MRSLVLAAALLTSLHVISQDHRSFLIPGDSFHRTRFLTVTGSITAGATASLLLLNQYWYANYPRSSFHFFDDSQEWLQMDKVAHAFNSYYMSAWASKLYEWSGITVRKAAVLGAVTGTTLLMTVEVLDGFSAKWGASVSDIAANVGGSGLFLAQEFVFRQQVMRLKVSAFPQQYDDFDAEVNERVRELFGHTLMETMLKNYNASTIWLSVNVNAITRWNPWPEWLNLALGYGAQNLFGGFRNVWCDDPLISPEFCPPHLLIDRSHIPRYRQWYLSPDIDLSRIHSEKQGVRLVLDILNIIKVPAPALEYNRIDGLKLHWLHF